MNLTLYVLSGLQRALPRLFIHKSVGDGFETSEPSNTHRMPTIIKLSYCCKIFCTKRILFMIKCKTDVSLPAGVKDVLLFSFSFTRKIIIKELMSRQMIIYPTCSGVNTQWHEIEIPSR